MIVQKCRQRLRQPAATRPVLSGHVAPNRSWRHGEPELQPKFCGNSLLSLCAIRGGHIRDQLLKLEGIRGRPRGLDLARQKRR
jgi:hypothetical protein